MSIGTENPKITSSVEKYALHRTFERALAKFKAFQQGGPGTLVLIAPTDQVAEDYKTSASVVLYEELEREQYNDVGYACISKAYKPEKMAAEYTDKCSKRDRAIVISETRNLPPLILIDADVFVDLEPIDEADLREACENVLKLKMTSRQAARLLTFPRESLYAALKKSRTIAETIKRLESVGSIRSDAKPIEEASLPLEQLHGYGNAKEWGLQLAADLKAWREGRLKWSEVDCGLLLSGPPGVGKTIFARALAETCGVHFLPTSITQWQATGYLNDLLRAMRADFATAVNEAPSILFLDELDSIGDRSTFVGEHGSYCTQVVNGLLEMLDGTGKRDGVVVIGATNFPEKIDPAIRRPGRLDRHVAIGLPGSADRIAILAQLLDDSAVEGLNALGSQTEGMSGADLAQVVRGGKGWHGVKTEG